MSLGSRLRGHERRARDPCHRYQGCRLTRPLRQGRKDWSLRWSWCRQDRTHYGADQQCCQGSWWLLRVAGVGERTREGNDLYHEMIEGGVISLNDKTSKVALVYGQMNEPPGARARVALTGLTVAEYFRDQEGQDVLLFIDNIFRFTQAGSEVSALLGRIPSA